MKRNVLTPQGEPVPDAGPPLTAGELMALSEGSGWRYELHAGRLVRKSVAGGGHDYIAYRLVLALGPYVDAHNLGAITLSQAGYNVTRPGEAETVWIPDLAFVRKERVPSEDSPEWSRFWPLAPDLIVEVVSPSRHRPEMEQRARDWIERGTQLVWIVWPAAKTVDVWVRAQTEGAPGAKLLATLTQADQLDGLLIIPGFACPVAQIFKGLR